MPWRLAGTRERSYRVGTADEMAAWVDDEIDTLTQGWIPLTSERQPDGSLRVLYGRLPADMDVVPKDVGVPTAAPAGYSPATHHRPPVDALLGGVAMLLAVVGVAFAFGLLAHP